MNASMIAETGGQRISMSYVVDHIESQPILAAPTIAGAPRVWHTYSYERPPNG
jgi:hypothetical protein